MCSAGVHFGAGTGARFWYIGVSSAGWRGALKVNNQVLEGFWDPDGWEQ